MASTALVIAGASVSESVDLFLPPRCSRRVELWTPIFAHYPKTPHGSYICRFNGVLISRKSWHRPLQEGDIVEWLETPPQDKDFLRTALQLAALVVGSFLPAPFNVIFAIGANLLINDLLPFATPSFQKEEDSNTYTTSISGNEARLDSPIPRICGRHQEFPPFAAKPYTEFDENHDQFYFALLAVGYGNHIVERVLIDDTDIEHFEDVIISQYLPPGTLPSEVLANVVTAPEVSNSNMESGQYIGGYAACGPRQLANVLGIDVIAPGGLGSESGGPLEVQWRVDYRMINEWGVPQGPWESFDPETRSANTTQTQRWSVQYILPESMRPEVRIVRLDAENTNLGARHKIVWTGLRAYLNIVAPLNANVAHYEIKMRASEQLSQLSQRKVSIIARAKVRTWHPSTGWGAEIFTRNPAWWLADLWTNSDWGEGLPDARVDLQTIYDYSLVWEARQDHFDFVFDQSMDAWQAAQLICRTGRAQPFRRGGIYSLARDEAVDTPITAFTPRNTLPESMSVSERLPTVSDPDGIIVEYFDYKQWDWTPLLITLPNVDPYPVNPVHMRLLGITGPTHATREGLYEAARMAYRGRVASCKTEMQGMFPAVLSAVKWQSDMIGNGQSGDVVEWDDGSLEAVLSEPPDFSAGGTHYIILIRDDGSLHDPIVVTSVDEHTLLLADTPDFTLVVDDGTRERPKYLFGTITTIGEIVRVASIKDGGRSQVGSQYFDVEGVIEDDRVHTADNDFLPGYGEIQDDIDSPPPVGGGEGELPVVNITNQNYDLTIPAGQGGPWVTEYSLFDEGTAEIFRDWPPDTIPLTSQWLLVQPVTDPVSGLFEVRATVVSGALAGGTVGTWLSLDTDRTWYIQTSGDGSSAVVQLKIEIRDVESATIQDTAFINLSQSQGQFG